MTKRANCIEWMRWIVANWLTRIGQRMLRETPEAPQVLPIDPVMARLRARFPDAPPHWLAMIALRSPELAAAPPKLAAVAPRPAAPSDRDPQPVMDRPRLDPDHRSAMPAMPSLDKRARTSKTRSDIGLQQVPLIGATDQASQAHPAPMRRQYSERPRMNIFSKAQIRREPLGEPPVPRQSPAVPRDVIAIRRPGGDAGSTVVRETRWRPVAGAPSDAVPKDLHAKAIASPRFATPPVCGLAAPTAAVQEATRSVDVIDNSLHERGVVLPGAFEQLDPARTAPPAVDGLDPARPRAPVPSVSLHQDWAHELWPSLPESDAEVVEVHATDDHRLRQMVRDQEAL